MQFTKEETEILVQLVEAAEFNAGGELDRVRPSRLAMVQGSPAAALTKCKDILKKLRK